MTPSKEALAFLDYRNLRLYLARHSRRVKMIEKPKRDRRVITMIDIRRDYDR